MIALDVAGYATGAGTLVLGIATLLGVIDARHRTRRVEGKTDAIQELVNGNADRDRQRIHQLTVALADAGIPIPVPDDGADG